jgi:uncharacterized membrane protein YqaE (UPF0057 family)
MKVLYHKETPKETSRMSGIYVLGFFMVCLAVGLWDGFSSSSIYKVALTLVICVPGFIFALFGMNSQSYVTLYDSLLVAKMFKVRKIPVSAIKSVAKVNTETGFRIVLALSPRGYYVIGDALADEKLFNLLTTMTPLK